MALYDGLPLDTPTKISDDGTNLEVWATRTQNGGTVEQRLKGAALTAQQSEQTIRTAVASALTRLRQIQTQATTFGAQAPYGAANLTNLNDLLSKSQLIAAAVGDIATDLIGLCRLLSNQFDATN